MDANEVARRVARVRERIEAAQQGAGRTGEVTLVAVTKQHPASTVEAAIAAGLGDIGENRVQELEQKVAEVGRDAARWHLIGRLQRNKVRAALPLFDLLHSLDSLRLAEAVSRIAVEAGREVRALVQINASEEASKAGFGVGEAIEAIGRMAELPALELEGLMTMAAFDADEAEQRRTFRAVRELSEAAARQVPAFTPKHLSMGMSGDFEIAVEEGSTLVRLGTVLFGERDEP
jgi:pyridoxal phosphate enzyme (YggS family)